MHFINAEKEDITIDETSHFSGTRIKGLYCDGYIAINKDIETETERACILAEELGHYYTSSGDIIDQRNIGKYVPIVIMLKKKILGK